MTILATESSNTSAVLPDYLVSHSKSSKIHPHCCTHLYSYLWQDWQACFATEKKEHFMS